MRSWRAAWLVISAAVALAVVLTLCLLWPQRRTPSAPPIGRDAARISAAIAGGDDADADVGPASPARPSGHVTPAPTWTVDRAASRLTFRGVMDGEDFDGVFRSWDARVAFDPKNLKGSKTVVIVDTESALTGQPLKDQALPNAEWLDISRFPEATLITREITQVGPGRYQAVVDVKIRGFTRRATVPFTVSVSHDVGHVAATLSLDRRDFRIGEGPWRSPPPVAPAFQVTLRLVAQKTP